MQNGRKILLEIDAFAQTVSTNKDSLLRAFHRIDALLPDIVRVFTGDDLQIDFRVLLLQERKQLLANVICGGNVTTKNYGVESVLQPFVNNRRRVCQLLVVT